MNKEDEERKRKLDNINKLFGKSNNISNNNDNSIYDQRQENINRLFGVSSNNSSSNTIKRDELKNYLSNLNSEKSSSPNQITVTTSDAVNEPYKIIENNEQNTVNKEIRISPTVNKSSNNFRNNDSNLINLNESNSNIKIATSEESKGVKKASDTDMYVLSGGNVDKRNNAEKTIDSISGIIGNLNEGINDFIPSIIDYISSGTENGAKNTIKQGLKLLGYSDEEVERISTTAIENYKKMSPISLLNSLLNSEQSEQQRNERIRINTLKASDNPFAGKLAELAPSVGSNIASMGITAINPVAGMASFMLSAGGSYLDDARDRGMTDEQAFGYATVMGALEGGTEYIISGNMVDKIGRTFIGKGLSDEVLNSFGVSTAENFFQEAIMDPMQELNATIFGGNDAANWDNIWQRSLEAGIDGILSAIILGGTSVGIASAENVVNKTNPTSSDYNQAIVDTINSEKVDVKGIVEGAKQAIINNEGMEHFYTATYNQDGNIESIQSVQGKQIENLNENVNITPVIIKNRQNNSYNVIDRNTGLLLDSSQYQTLIAAQTEFNRKISNLDNASIKNINNKIAQANITIKQETAKTQSKINASQTANRNVVDNTQTGLNNVNASQNNADTNVNTNNTYQTSENEFTDGINNNTQNYISNDINSVRSRNNGLNEISKLMTQISDNSIYNRERTSQVFETVTRNIPSIELQVNDNGTYLNSLDINGNVVYQQEIPNRVMLGGEIRDIVSNAINNTDLSRINNTQTNENQFKSVSNNETTNYVSDNINENVEQNNEQSNKEIRNIVKYNQDGREISDEDYVDFLVERYKDNKNISGIITDTQYIESIEDKIKKDKISDLYGKIKDKEFKITKELKDENGELQNINIDLVITKRGLSESFNKGISNEKYAIVPYLDEIIKTSKDGTIRAETKMRSNIMQWYYLYNTAEINGELYGVKVDIKKTPQGDRFYVHRVNLVHKNGTANQIPAVGNGTIKINTVPSEGLGTLPRKAEVRNFKPAPSTNTSISQNNSSVKNNTNATNKSMQNNKNNTQNIQKELHNRIQNAILSKNSRKNTFLGIVSDKVVNKVKSLFGIDISGRRHIISDNDIRHMIKQHGNPTIEEARGQIAITTQDIEKIPDIIASYDSIEKGSMNKDAFTKQELNTIRYKKQYSDNTTYVVEVIPSNSNNLTIKTMWKKKNITNKKNNSSRVNHANNNIDPQNTPKAEPTSSYSTKSIPQNKQNVKDNGIRAEKTSNTTSEPYDARKYEKNSDFMSYLKENNYLKTLMEVDSSQGETYAHSPQRLIEQEIRKLESTGNFDNSIPVTKLTDIDKEIENYLGKTIGKGHFRERARGIYNQKYDTISVKEYKDLDNVLHELGHALDLGGRIKVDKASLSDELLAAIKRHGGYENENIGIQLDEGFAEILKTYAINKEIVKQDYPKSYKVLEDFKSSNVEFGKFITKIQQETYNYIHQNPQNRLLSNMSIGEQTDKTPVTVNSVKENVMRWVWDSNYSIKEMTRELAKVNGNKLSASQNVYLLTRLASGVDNKAISMISDGYIDLNGNRVMPGLNKLGEILGNDSQRWNDLRSYLVAQRDLEYKAKSLKTGVRTMDSKAVVEQFYNDSQIQDAAQVVYDTLDGVLQYAVDNGLINEDTAKSLRESNAFYVPFQRVIEGRGNQVGKRGAVANIINRRTGSELDIKDVLENIVANSANIIQQVENNNILRTLAEQGEEAGINNNIFKEIPAPMKKIGTEQLSTWEAELKNQGVDTSNLDLEKTIDLFVPNNNIITEKNGSHIVSYFDKNGKRKYLEFYKNSTDIFNALMGLDKNANSIFLKIMRAANMPLRYGATMANVGFAIPNMISDTVQASIFSEAGFIPVVDNVLGVLDVLGSTNKTVRNFLNKVAPSYIERINRIYDIYQQTGASSSTRMSQYRKSTQEIMEDIYGTDSKSLGIKDSFKPLKRLMDILTYIPELSEQSTRFRVFERNYEAMKNKGTSELDARIQAAIESRDSTQDFGRTGTVTHEINQLIPFSAARVGSAYTFAERVRANPKRVMARTAILLTVAMAIKAIGYDDDEIEELNQRKKDDNFIIKVGDTIITIKKPQGILRSMINLIEYVQDLATGHIEKGKEGERLVEWTTNAIMDNMPADSVTGLVPNAITPVVENAINKDFYYNTDIVKSWDLDLPDEQQYYDYTSQLAIWLGQVFNYSPAKIDNLISGYLGGLGTQLTNTIDWISGKMGLSVEEPAMGAEDNAIGKRFVVNVNENSASVDEIYSREEELTKKLNGGTITEEENTELENIKAGISKLSALNKQIKAIKQDLTMSGEEKAEAIRPLQEQKTDVARQALGKEPIYTENTDNLEALEFYPSRSTLSYNGLTLNLTEDMKTEYMNTAYELYKKYKNQGLYSNNYLETLKSKVKDVAKKEMLQKYKNQLVRSN